MGHFGPSAFLTWQRVVTAGEGTDEDLPPELLCRVRGHLPLDPQALGARRLEARYERRHGGCKYATRAVEGASVYSTQSLGKSIQFVCTGSSMGVEYSTHLLI
jgi:hypothetical protein